MNDAAPIQFFKCFVVMPFSDTEHLRDGRVVKTSVAEWNHIFENWIKKAVETFKPQKFRCFRSAALPGNFIKGIVHELYSTEIVIADLTGSRPNVYYELGIRHALETGTIMITQDLRSVPSDLKGYYCFEYKYTSEHHEYESHYQKFEKDLHDKIGHFFENPGVSDNPVSDFIGHRNAFLDERFEREKAEMIFLMENLFKIVERNYHLCEMLLKAKTEQDYEFDEILLFDFFPFDLLLTRFINTRWELLPMTMLESVHEALETFRSLFLPIHQGWNVLRINPSSEANHNFLDLVEAVVQNKQEGMEKLSEEVLGELRKLSYTITYTPKHSKKD